MTAVSYSNDIQIALDFQGFFIAMKEENETGF